MNVAEILQLVQVAAPIIEELLKIAAPEVEALFAKILATPAPQLMPLVQAAAPLAAKAV